MHISDVHEYGVAGEYDEAAKPYLERKQKESLKREIANIVDAEFDRLEEYAGEFISAKAADRSQRFLERVLRGEEDAAKALLGDESNDSRYRSMGCDAGKPWANLIHGRLFETNGIELRRLVVEANADLLVSERIKDLESIVDGLTRQLHEKQAQIDRLTI